MTIQAIHDLKEKNGLPIFINNLNKHHNLDLMSKVTINLPNGYDQDSWINSYPDFLNHQIAGNSFYIIKHARDCDGTILYHISNNDFNTSINLCNAFRHDTNSLHFNKAICRIFGLNLVNDKGQFFNLDDAIAFNRILKTKVLMNLSEESLKLIKNG